MVDLEGVHESAPQWAIHMPYPTIFPVAAEALCA
jgi:hypothetical protein